MNPRMRIFVELALAVGFLLPAALAQKPPAPAPPPATPPSQPGRVSGMGIPRRELTNCELRATVSGFRSNVVNLMELTPVSSSMDVGAIVVHRTEKIKGMTLNASAYNAPKDARRAYEKGIEAEKHGKLADARQSFEKAVEIDPKYTNAWFQLGAVLQNLAQKESARTAYIHATKIDSKFLPPY